MSKTLNEDDVLKEIDRWIGYLDEDMITRIKIGIKKLPSAQPERPKGKWIYDGDCYICDQCKSAFGWWADSQTSNYCPNCGADMRGEAG